MAWYGLRSWIEAGFKDIKGGGLGGHHRKMHDAGRVERLWLAMAVAMVGMVGLGSQADRKPPRPSLEPLPEKPSARKRMRTGTEPAAGASFKLSATRTAPARLGLVQSGGLSCWQAGARTLA